MSRLHRAEAWWRGHRGLMAALLAPLVGWVVLPAISMGHRAVADDAGARSEASAADDPVPALGAEAAAADPWPVALELAARVDAHLAAGWSAAGIQPAAAADDAEFLRRVFLDLVGRIPSAGEARQWLDEAPLDRQPLIDELLASPAHATRVARLFTASLLPEASSEYESRLLASTLSVWLRRQYVAGQPYDVLVRDLLTASIGSDGATSPPPLDPIQQAGPLGFFFAKGGLPHEIAAAAARSFLGVRLDCAQCHDHPFADWRREQFWELTAFVSGVEPVDPNQRFSPLREIADRREVTIPDTDTTISARFLDGSVPDWSTGVAPRQALAEWIASAENAYFARAAANRVWAWLFGTGLVDPVDDFDPSNPPSHPELLDELAERFAADGFDLRYLMRGLVSSRAYGLSSARSHETQADARQFAVVPVRRLSADQLYDSLSVAVGHLSRDESQAPAVYLFGQGRSLVGDEFSDAGADGSEAPVSVLQALFLMNGAPVAEWTSVEGENTVAAVAAFPAFSTADRIEALYLATLTRRPTPDESARLVAYVDGGSPHGDAGRALSDVFWALLNSSEFLSNH